MVNTILLIIVIVITAIILCNDFTQLCRGYFTPSLQAYHILPLVEVSCLSIRSLT